MKKFAKSITLFLSVLVIASCLTFTANAASANLTTNMSIAYSGTLSAKQCYYSGNNQSTEDANKQEGVVYAIVKYKSGAIYVTDVSYTMNAGEKFTNQTTSKFSSNKTWELVLNPKGTNATGCKATGTITKKL